MIAQIKILAEYQSHGKWLKIFIPYAVIEKITACLQDTEGKIIRKVFLSEGNNAIDINDIKEELINVKIETESETILKNISLKK